MLAIYVCSTNSTCSRCGPTYVVDFTPLLLVGVGPGDSSESSKKPFSHCVDGVGGGYTGNLGPAGGDIEAKEVPSQSPGREPQHQLGDSVHDPFLRSEEAVDALRRHAVSPRDAT